MKAGHSEVSRQLVHVSMAGFALLLRWLNWQQALALAGGALLFNLVALPRLAPRLFRPGDRERGLHGILYYPLSVLILILLFPDRLYIVAAAWGILAAGDGVATLAGRAIGGARWPWNPNKTVAGTVAFIVCGATAGSALSLWCRSGDFGAWTFALAAVPTAAVAAGFVETIPITLDDNLSVALSAGGTLWLGAMIVARHFPPPDFQDAVYFQNYAVVLLQLEPVGMALLVNGVFAAVGYGARTVTIAGAIGGAVIGIVVYASLGWQGWTLLFVTFLAAAIASHTGLARKQRLGIAEERGGRRGPGNAIANTGAAAIAAVLAGLDVHGAAAHLAFAAALATTGSDTIASEIGKAFGRRTFSIATLSRVAPGTSGAISLEGTIAGVLGALGLGAFAAALGLVGYSVLSAIVIGATAGALLESWLGATLEGPGILNNDVLNFINSVAGIAVTLVVWRWLR